MAIKKFLMENGKQVWPITRADCIYTVKGDELLNTVVDRIAKDLLDEVARAKTAEEQLGKDIVAEKERAEGKEEELAQAIADEVQDRVDAVKGVQDQLDALKGEGQGSVAEQINAAKQELQQAVDSVAQDLADFEGEQAQKNSALEQKDGELAQSIADEKAAQALVNTDFEGRIAANEAFVAAHDHKAMEDRLDALEELHKKGGVVEEAIKAVQEALDEFIEDQGVIDGEQDKAIQAAQKAADDAQADVDALEEVVGKKSFVDESGDTVPATGLMQEMAQNAAQIAAERSRAEGQEAAIRQEMADEAVRVNKKIADDIAAESALRVAEEGKIRGEFAAADAALKAELQGEIDADVAAEAELRVAADNKIREDFAVADSALDKKIDKEIEDREAAIEGLVNGDIAALKAFKDNHSHEQMKADIAQLQQDVDKVEEAIGVKAEEGKAGTGVYKYIDDKVAAQANDMNQTVQDLARSVSAEESSRKTEDQRLAGLINDLQADVDANETTCANAVAGEKAAREAADNVLDGKIAQEVQDRVAAVSGEAKAREDADIALDNRLKDVEAIIGLDAGDGESLSDRVKANEDKLAGLEKDTVQAAIDQAEADAKSHAEQKIAELVDSAPEAMDTLKELAEAINANKGVYDAYVEQHATAMAAMKSELQAEIDADVLVEKERAEGQEAAIRGELAQAIAKEVTDRDAAIKLEADRALAAEQAIQKQINEGLKTKAYNGDIEYDDLTPIA